MTMKNSNRIALLLLSLAFVAGLALLLTRTQATPVDEAALAAANQLYAAGHYTEAAALYEQMASQGAVDSAVLYNLGNAYFQQGDLSRAAFNYERALRLAPRDADIRANLALVQAQTADLGTAADGPPALLARWGSWLTLNETAVLALGLWFLLTFLLLWQTPRRRLRGVTLLVLVLFLAAGVLLSGRIYVEQVRPHALVTTGQVAGSSASGSAHDS